MKRKDTKTWILESSLTLFNRYGTGNISTKRIAREMGISPGNLYYHFNNKEEIIREIMVASWEAYPFFRKEFLILCKNDPELKKWYLKTRKHLFMVFKKLVNELIVAGDLVIPDNAIDTLCIITRIIAEHWINYLEISGESLTRKNLYRGIGIMMQVWKPYFTSKSLNEINRLRKNLLEKR